MKVILTKKTEIKSKKDNKEYVIVSYLDPLSGEAEKVIVEKSVYESFDLDESSYLSKEELSSFATKAPLSDIQFTNRGRVSTIS